MNDLLKIIFFIIWFMPWLATYTIFLVLGFYRRPNKNLDVAGIIHNGDVLLIRRRMRSPWGYWGHSGIVVDAKEGKVLHSVSLKGVEVVSINRFYCADEIAVFRPRFIDNTFSSQINTEIKKYIGKKFSYLSFKNLNTFSKFSCTTIVWRIFFDVAKVKVPSGIFVVPNDFTNKDYFDLVTSRK